MSLTDQLEEHKIRLEELSVDKPVFKAWVKQVTEMQTTVLQAENMVELKRDATVKALLKTAKDRIADIDKQLSTKRGLTDDERFILFEQKGWNEFFINLFAKPAKMLKASEKRLKITIAGMRKNGY